MGVGRKTLVALLSRLGRSRVVIRPAVRVRDTCQVLIRHSLHDGMRMEENGEAWLARLEAPQASVFVDVGANVGNWTAMFIQSMRALERGLLFDPSRTCAVALCERFAAVAQIEVVEAAVSGSTGTAVFYEHGLGGEMSSLVSGYAPDHAPGRSVRVTTLDSEADRRGLQHIDFLKIDAEGYDHHVLLGGSRLLSAQRIGVVQFEYHKLWADAGATLAGTRHLLESCGYSVLLLRATGLFEVDFGRYGEYFGYSNYVALSRRRRAALEPFVRRLR